MRDLTDATLVKQVISGKRECYRPLVDKYQTVIYHLACSLIHNSTEAQDIAQETFLTAFKNIRKLKDHAKFGSWLYGITRNLCLETLRKRKKEPEYVDTEILLNSEQSVETKITELNGHDITDTLITKLSGLPEKYQSLLRLKYMQDYSYQQIATMLDLPVDLVRSRLFEGRKLLREELSAEVKAEAGIQNYA